ncbi:tetratricopeptide repeat protein [Saccharothrix sp. Mg75]|uniref:tetratricopeptide repeat protein n=1 Tax=Saccharothrix sp. Mg75 TaxID=3445357 RepID=UPI003EEFA806
MPDRAHEAVGGPHRAPPAGPDVSSVAGLEAFTGEVRALDRRYGGALARDAAVGRLPSALGLLDFSAPGLDGVRLRTAVADLHSAAGWAAFDTGMVGAALGYFNTAVTLAASVGDGALTAEVYCRVGRLWLHHREPSRALAEFRLGGLAAEAGGSSQAGGSSRVAALLGVNTAWAWARLGQEAKAVALLAEVEGDLAGAPGATGPLSAASADLSVVAGMVRTELAVVVDPRYARLAVPLLAAAVAGYGGDRARGRAFGLISLAVCHLLDDRVDDAVEAGGRAVDLCERLVSARTAERLRPLRNEAERRRSHRGARALADRIRAFRQPTSGPW